MTRTPAPPTVTPASAFWASRASGWPDRRRREPGCRRGRRSCDAVGGTNARSPGRGVGGDRASGSAACTRASAEASSCGRLVNQRSSLSAAGQRERAGRHRRRCRRWRRSADSSRSLRGRNAELLRERLPGRADRCEGRDRERNPEADDRLVCDEDQRASAGMRPAFLSMLRRTGCAPRRLKMRRQDRRSNFRCRFREERLRSARMPAPLRGAARTCMRLPWVL